MRLGSWDRRRLWDRRRGSGGTATLFGALLLCGGASGRGAAAGEAPRAAPPPFVRGDDTSWRGADGRLRWLYRPRFLSAADLLAGTAAFGLPGVDLAVDPGRRRLLLTAAEPALDGAREALEFLDVPTPEVLVEVSIVETLKRTRCASGGHVLFDRDIPEGAPDTFFRGLRYDFEPDAWLRSTLVGQRPFEGGSVAFGQASPSGTLAGTVSAVFRRLATEGEADFLAQPALACTQGVPASVSATTALPTTVFSAATAGPGGFAITTELRSEKVGVSLEVTAERIGSDHVTLLLHPWVRRVTETSAVGGPVGAPVLESREASTRVVLYDGDTTLVGSIGSLGRLRSRRGLPGLDRLHGVDSVLSARDGETRDSEILFLVRASILRPGRTPAPTMPPSEVARLMGVRSRARLIPSGR